MNPEIYKEKNENKALIISDDLYSKIKINEVEFDINLIDNELYND